MRRGVLALLLPVLLPVVLLACATPRPASRNEIFRLSSIEGEGDAARRASTRLVLQGLDADAAGMTARAQASYEQALRVDATNPWAYLALARHRLEAGDPDDAFAYLDQVESLLRATPEPPPGVDAHLIGLRGAALERSGRPEDGARYLARARTMDPAWSDGRLSARELR